MKDAHFKLLNVYIRTIRVCTVAKISCYPHMLKGMTNEGLFSCLQAGSPKGLAVATAARPLHPYRMEV